jgi:glutamate dehydrogenase
LLGRIPAARQAIIDCIAASARRARRQGTPVAADRLARFFYHGVSELDLVQRADTDLAGAALAALSLGRLRRPGRAQVRVFNPEPAKDGFASSHTVIMVVTDDMPFLVDSLSMVCSQTGLAVHLLAHPVFSVVRDRRGRLTGLFLDDAPAGARLESWQPSRLTANGPRAAGRARTKHQATLDDIRAATGDWRRCARRRASRGRARATGFAATQATLVTRGRCSSGWTRTTSRSSAIGNTACSVAQAATGWCPPRGPVSV